MKEKIIKFLREIDKFKEIKRTIYRTDGKEETNTDHCWHLCMWLMAFEKDLPKDIDFARVLKLAIIHDLPEIYAGDTFAFADKKEGKAERELEAAKKLFSQLPEQLATEMLDLWKEYEETETKEAKIVRGMDRIQAINQNIITDGKIWKDYKVPWEKISKYKLEYVSHDDFLLSLYNFHLEEAKKVLEDKD